MNMAPDRSLWQIAPPMSLSIDQVAALENAYRDGISAHNAAVIAKVSGNTAFRYFRHFRFLRVPRAPRPPKKPARHGRFRDCPAYTGPIWIGKRA